MKVLGQVQLRGLHVVVQAKRVAHFVQNQVKQGLLEVALLLLLGRPFGCKGLHAKKRRLLQVLTRLTGGVVVAL